MKWLDRLSIGLSVLCLIHCMALPLVIAVLPFAANLGLESEAFHMNLLLTAIPISSFAFWRGFRCHGNVRVLAFGSLGLFFMAIALLPQMHVHESMLTMFGVISLASAHFFNNRLTCRMHGHQH